MIISEKAVLRHVIDSDIDMLFELRNNFEIQKLLLSRPRPNDKQKLMNWLRSRIDSDTKELFIVAEKQTNKPVGFTQLNNIDFLNRHTEFGVCIHPDYFNQGYFKATVGMLETYLFNNLNIQKMIAYVRSDNTVSTDAMLRMGFNLVGVFKKHFIIDAIEYDVTVVEKILK